MWSWIRIEDWAIRTNPSFLRLGGFDHFERAVSEDALYHLVVDS
jgi:hypothetical protein